jgi:hypothetical protein
MGPLGNCQTCPWVKTRLIWSVRTQLLAENGLWNADLRFGSGNICNPSPPHPNARFWMLRVYPMCVVMLSLCQFFLNRRSNKDTCMSKPGFRVTVTLATLGVMWIRSYLPLCSCEKPVWKYKAFKCKKENPYLPTHLLIVWVGNAKETVF